MSSEVKPRLSRENYLMAVAQVVALRSTCDRARVGSVLARKGRILATGYNGALPGQPHCDEIGHLMVDDHCVRSVHAEQNALIQCAIHQVSPVDSDLYVTHYPCLICAKLLISAGIRRIYYVLSYNSGKPPDDVVSSLFQEMNIYTTVMGHL